MPTANAAEPGCPGCFASFNVNFDFNFHNCGSAFDTDPSDYTGINFGVSGNVLWVYNYEISDWQTWMPSTSTSSSFTGVGSWNDASAGTGYPYEFRSAIELNWF